MLVKMMRSKFALVALALPFLLLGCETYRAAPRPQLVAEPDPLTVRLANAADRAADALATLAAIEQKRTPVSLPPLAVNAPTELRRTMTVDWYGPPALLLQQMADIAGYNFQETGAKPTIPLVVRLEVRNRPIIEVMRDIGLQVEGRAAVKVDANARIVEISY